MYLRLSYILASVIVMPSSALAAEPPKLGAVFETVSNTLRKAKATIENKDVPPLKSVTLNLSTKIERTAGGSINIFLVSVDAEDKSSRSQKQTIVLGFDPYEVEGSALKIRTEDVRVSDLMAAAINQTFAKLKTNIKGAKPKSFKLTFTLAASSKGGGSLSLATPIKLKAGGSVAPSNAQEFVFQFGEETKAKAKPKG